MKRRQLYLFGFVGTLLLTLTGIYVFSKQGNEVYAANAVYEGEAYPIQFTLMLKPESVTNGMIFVVDAIGNTVNASFTLSDSKKELFVTGLKAGQYTIHVKKGAFMTKTKFKRDRTVSVQVMESVTALKTEDDLKAYFEAVLKRNESQYSQRFSLEAEFATPAPKNEVASDSSGASSERSSTTNNQVAGIEEGDIVITDGQAIYSVMDNGVVITDAKKPNSMKVMSRITLKDGAYPTHLMKQGELLIVVYSAYVEQRYKDYYDGKSITKAAFYNVSDLKNPQLVREIGQDGYAVGVRKMNNILYLVTNQTPNYWLMRDNQNIELRPAVYEGEKEEHVPIDRIHPLPGTNEPNYLIVSAVELANIAEAAVKTESYLGNSGQMYMSEKAIYIAATKYAGMPFFPVLERTTSDSAATTNNVNETTIYKIAIDQANSKLAAEGTITGTVLNQFSMDEHKGYFRIATTEGSSWGTDANSTNTLYILDDQLKEAGKIANLARGERIYSVRFMGDKAYMVTFKETDPLFVLDVANPRAPKVLGELKIPGFSNYLHPIGEHHLLGLGYDTKVTMPPGSKEPLVLTQGMKLSLFNVSNLANPIEQDTVIIGGRGTYSAAQHDHKALFRDVDNDYYGFPVTLYEEKGEYDVQYKGTGAHIYQVTTEGIELAANLMMPAKKNELYEDWESNIQRLLYINDSLYTVSRKEIKSYTLNGFTPISTVTIK